MAPETPKTSKVLANKNGTNSSNKKMKQSSLLSFFSKSPSAPTKKTGSTKGKSFLSSSRDTTAVNSSSATASSSQKKQKVPEEIDLESSVEHIQQTNKTPIGKSSTKSTQLDDSTTDQQEFAEDSIIDDSLEVNSSRRGKRKVNYAESDEDDEDVPLSSSSKKPKLFTVDSDEDDDYQPTKQELKDQKDLEKSDDLLVGDDNDFIDDDDDDDDILELSSKPKVTKPKPKRKMIEATRKPQIKPSVPKPKGKTGSNFTKHNEERYYWLVDEKDAQKRPVSDPEYDPRTLYIPSSAWAKFTAFEKQYWEIKSKMWDCVVFFKKGKFFELYEKDALLANSLFDWKLAGNGRANMQLAGVPEMSFEYWASQFIEHGYKVAKVDQKESMLSKEMREGSKGIVKRELEYVLTAGTLTEGDMIHSDLATYCLAIREEPGNFYAHDDYSTDEKSYPDRIFGISFIDTSTGEVQLIEFEDDSDCTKLDTIMSQVKPKELILEKDNLSSLANKIVKFNASSRPIFNEIKPEVEFYDYEKTYDVLTSDDSEYFKNVDNWPEILQSYYKNQKKVGFSAFGALLYYLKWLQLDKSLLSMGNMKEYDPIRSQNSLILDGITLQNLEIFSNSFDGTSKGSLFQLFNKAITSMGKRMMRRWLMHPLLNKDDINKRLDSVELLMSDLELKDNIESVFSRLPDLERMLAKIHTCTIKVKDFERVIQGFEDIETLLLQLKDSETELKGALSIFFNEVPESLYGNIDTWKNAYNREKAQEEGIILPHRGIEPDFDKSLDEIQTLEDELNELLNEYKKKLHTNDLSFKDSGKEIFTIEIPVKAVKYVPSDWVQMAANKSTKRYYSDEVRILARAMAEARETHKVLEEDLRRRLCKKFDAAFMDTWTPTVHAISNIDCLLSLAKTSESLGFVSCRPEFVDEVDETTGEKLNGFMRFKQLRHPCFGLGTTIAKDFISNDIELGNGKPQLGLLTGANAAGKSTVLRMTCVAVIMAQMGCYVPCESATLSPVDRIMTRLGANDNIMQGKSTFFVELSETKKILDLATRRSLLVVDELGRGGSSSDGFAIAEAVLHHVATHIQSLGFFATHYANLGLSFKGHPQVRPMKMAILVDESTRNVTFLYKLEDGQSEGSFGMHVATMCGIAKSIVDNAQIAADKFEHTTRIIKEKQIATSGIKGEIVEIPFGLQSDFVRIFNGDGVNNTALGTGEGVLIYDNNVKRNAIQNIFKLIEDI